jgi:hypothetical protein
MNRKWSVLKPLQQDPSKTEAQNTAARRLAGPAVTLTIDPRPEQSYAIIATFVVIMVLHQILSLTRDDGLRSSHRSGGR